MQLINGYGLEKEEEDIDRISNEVGEALSITP